MGRTHGDFGDAPMMDLREQARLSSIHRRNLARATLAEKFKAFVAVLGVVVFMTLMAAGGIAWLYVFFHFITKYW